MPLTFPSHLAPVLPLKLWRPRWFDGVALAAGAVAPDVAYLALDADGRLFADTHTWQALLWWCLPVALAYTWVVRRTIATVAVHLPDGRRFTWRAYAELAHHRHRWPITVGSCLLGAASHVAWDRLTHTDGWIHTVFGVRWADVSTIPWWTVSDLASTVIGAAVVVGVAVRAGRRSGHDGVAAPTGPGGGSGPPAARPRVFWTTAVVSGLAGLAAVPSLPGAELPAATGVRLLHVVAAALLSGVVAVRVSAKRSRNQARTTPP
ncbi:DUF4184 family protein [Catellatospora citrea]|uniref:DUF4184 family protein n=1 Tax=Catellatospora citrea TaxID=53366 RepID=A0A8J3P2D1_9ACTN|nr:DUF4184 family protein [Catellatospora citrea]RKE06306.1 uncharacterized protein DUF4184 [Catellatospora citrea]GIG01068.1 hypothetical protein Cci01nite_61610 [Catellatospora citrea]